MSLVHITLSFYLISPQHDFLNRKNSGVREELSDLLFLLQTQLQKITVKEHIIPLVHAPPQL